MATVAELVAVLRADTRQFQTAVGGASASTSAFGKVGSQVGVTVGLALAAGVAKAADAFLDFEETMTRTTTLAGSTQEQMHALSEEVLALAPTVGKGPQELAESLYQVQSAGIDAGNAMEVVESAAKASAIGLGETQVVADAVTSVLNAYGQENISAAQATDVLVAAVREGKGEADAIAGAIGRVIPIASQMGVGFDEVAAAIASMTRLGLDANESVTALRGALTAMLDPTKRAEETLAAYGFTVDELQRSIAQQGILGTLLDLQAAFGKNDRAMSEVFPNVRALSGVLNLVGENAAETARIFEDVAGSVGGLDAAFATLSETAGFRLKQAVAAFQVALVQAGAVIVPILVAVVDNMEGLLAVSLGFAAVRFLPPLLTSLAAALGGVATSAGAASLAASGVLRVLGPWGLAIGAAAVGAKVLEDAIYGTTLSMEEAEAAIAGQLLQALGTGAISFEEYRDAVAEANADLGHFGGSVSTSAGIALESMRTKAAMAAEAEHELGAQASYAAAQIRLQTDATLALADPTFALVSAVRADAEASAALADARARVVRLEEQGKEGSKKYAEAVAEVAARSLAAATAQAGLFAQVRSLEEAVRGGASTMDEAVASLRAIGEAAGLSKPEIRALVEEVRTGLRDAARFAAEEAPKIGEEIVAGLETAIREGAQAVADAAVRVVTEAMADAREAAQARSPSKVMEALGRDMMLGLAQGISGTEGVTDALVGLIDALRDAAQEGFGEVHVAAAQELARMGKALSAELAHLEERVASFRDSLRSGFADVADLVGGAMEFWADLERAREEALEAGEMPAELTPGALSDYFSGQLEAAEEFARVLAELEALGLRPKLLAELAAQGPEALPFIQALLAGGADLVAEFNETAKAINQVTRDAISSLTEEVFGKHFKVAAADVKAFAKQVEDFLAALEPKVLAREITGLIDAVHGLAKALKSIGNFAHGGVQGASGLAVVGERGPELVHLPGGSRVSPFAVGAAGATRVADIVIDLDGREVARIVGVHLVDEIRSRGAVRR